MNKANWPATCQARDRLHSDPFLIVFLLWMPIASSWFDGHPGLRPASCSSRVDQLIKPRRPDWRGSLDGKHHL